MYAAFRIGLLLSAYKPSLSSTKREIIIYYKNSQPMKGDYIYLTKRFSKDDFFYQIYPVEASNTTDTLHEAYWNSINTGRHVDLQTLSTRSFQKTCMYYYAILFRGNGTRLTQTCLKTEPTWMRDGESYLGPQKIHDIFIPGTHDSAAYNLYQNFLGVALKHFVITQDFDILTQLMYGVRFLDIRVGYYASEITDKWWAHHGSQSLVPMREVIEDVKTFLMRTQEIVIFNVHEFPYGIEENGLNDPESIKNHNELANYLTTEFAQYLIPSQKHNWHSTLHDIWATGRNLIIAYNRDSVWRHNKKVWRSVRALWGDVRQTEDLINYINTAYQENFFGYETPRPRAAMAALTPGGISAVGPFFYSGLRTLSLESDLPITYKYQESWGLVANIVAVNFVKSTGIIEAAIEYNKKRFGRKCKVDEVPPAFEIELPFTI